MDELNLSEGALRKTEQVRNRAKRYRAKRRKAYNDYHAEYYAAHREEINRKRRERYRLKQGGTNGV